MIPQGCGSAAARSNWVTSIRDFSFANSSSVVSSTLRAKKVRWRQAEASGAAAMRCGLAPNFERR